MSYHAINVPLTENELLIIASWINKLRDVHYDSPWSDEEIKLSSKFEKFSEMLFEHNF